MRKAPSITLGLFCGGVFCAGWLFDPGAKATLVSAFVCGMSAALSQLSTRDLLAKAQSMVDRGADDYFVDGGELHERALSMRSRIEKLCWMPVFFGVLAPGFATLRTLISHPLWTALAFTCAAAALFFSVLLFALNRIMTTIVDKERLARAQAKRVREMTTGYAPLDSKLQKEDPNLSGYGFGGVATEVTSPTEGNKGHDIPEK